MTKKVAYAYSLRRRFNLFLHHWHRRIGVTASVFLIWMAVSGWLLNHTSALDLAHRMVTLTPITAHYGLHANLPKQALVAGSHWLATGADKAVLDGRKIAITLSQPRGMVKHTGMLFVATATRVILLAADGTLIDKIDAPLTRIDRIGSGCNGVVVADSERRLVTHEGVAWSSCHGSVQWARSAALTPAQRDTVAPLLAPGISVERLLLDLHSGRFFGAWGPYFVDAVGLALTVLALSGIWLFVRHRKPHRRDRH